MKTPLITTLTALLTLAACGDRSDVYYATVYPVVRVEAEVTIPAEAPPEGEEAPENPLVAQIREEVVANAPVRPGGRYELDFVRFDGGRLRVLKEEGAAPVEGTFLKTPGRTDLAFNFDGLEYTCAVTAYSTDEGERALLTVTLTQHYQELYPDAGITRVVRREYTTHDKY